MIPPPFDRCEVAIPPGAHIAPPDDDWADAIVVVEEGELVLVGSRGHRVQLGIGGVLWLHGLALRSLHNPGQVTTILGAVRRVPSRRVPELPEQR